MSVVKVARTQFVLSQSVLAPPTTLQIAVSGPGNTTFTLTWTDVASNGTTVVERSPTNNSHFTTLATVAIGVQTYVDSGLSGTYYYRVRSFNIQYGYSTYSNEVHASTGA